MEDVADNLFNPDPYLQQGGDMVRVGGMDYACAPNESRGKAHFGYDARRRHAGRGRQDLSRRRLGLGQSAKRRAGVGVVEKYLGANRTLTIKRANRVTLKGVANNPGIIGGG